MANNTVAMMKATALAIEKWRNERNGPSLRFPLVVTTPFSSLRLHQKDALAGCLSVEQLIGFFRLIEGKFMGEQ